MTDVITPAEMITQQDYTVEENRRHLEHLGGWVDVFQIRLTHNTQMVGYIMIGEDNLIFGAAECSDGSVRVVDGCLPDSFTNRHAMIADVIGVWAEGDGY